jgi:ABC-type uncharacterized transport system substrate-binding protein
MRSDPIRLAAALALLFLLTAGFPGRTDCASGDAAPRIAILSAGRGERYEETRAGFVRRLRELGLRPVLTTFFLDDPGGRPAFRDAARGGFDAVLALGGDAAETAARDAGDLPVVAGGVLRPDAIPKGGGATGVYLEYPPELSLRWIRTALPGARVVGVLYNPAENRERIEAAARTARELGLRLEARAVSAPQDIPAALDALYRRSDVVWTLYDRVATTPGTARRLLLDSFRHRVPLIGLSASWAQAGAFSAPDWDHDDIGAQCAEAVARILKGEKASGIPPAAPRKTLFSINLNSARKLDIRVPKAAEREARRLFPGKE